MTDVNLCNALEEETLRRRELPAGHGGPHEAKVGNGYLNWRTVRGKGHRDERSNGEAR